MTTPVYDWPLDWYELIVTSKYRLRSMSQMANRPWIAARSISGPHAQFWLADITLAPTVDPNRQDIEGFFARLRGQSGLMRIADVTHWQTYYDKAITPTTSGFSDGTEFSDGTGFADGYLPPNVFISTAAAAGARYLILKGFPASTSNVLRRGDRLQVLVNGVATSVPHLYQVVTGGSSDADGKIGVSIEPGLRAGVMVGDTVSLRYAAGVFRLIDDTQAEMEMSSGKIGNVGFSLIEALDQVP